MVIAFILFFIAGLTFGYAVEGWAKWLPMLFPIALALGAIVNSGLDGAVMLRLIVALIVTAIGVLLGQMIDQRGASRAASA
jgi:hypothetical protein